MEVSIVLGGLFILLATFLILIGMLVRMLITAKNRIEREERDAYIRSTNLHRRNDL